MRNLLSFIEQAKLGFVGSGAERDQVTHESFSEADWQDFARVQPFVFHDHETIQIPPDKPTYVVEGIDAPFPVFSVECLNTSIAAVSHQRHNLPADLSEANRTLDCIVAIEINPREFDYYALTHILAFDSQHKPLPARTRVFCLAREIAEPLVKALLEKLGRSAVGAETSRTKVKIGVGKTKRHCRINSIIHVKRKTAKASDGLASRNIDWSHRFSVRGHWRKVDCLGKNRAGVPVVRGFTWVNEHVRGAEHLPFIKKTRLVINKGEAT